MRRFKYAMLLGGTLLAFHSLRAQQESMFSIYMFNPLHTNPAYAGAPGHLEARAIHRSQWVRMDGAPLSQAVSVSSPFKTRVGLGLNLERDQLGVRVIHKMAVTYAYRFQVAKGQLGLGIQAGVENWKSDFSKLDFKDPYADDPSFANLIINQWLPQVGIGAFYSAPRFYAGLSTTNLLEMDFKKSDNAAENTYMNAQRYRHLYFTVGGLLPIQGDMLQLKPSMLVKSVGLLNNLNNNNTGSPGVGAPTEFDLDLGLLWYNTMWTGIGFRSAFAARAWGGNSSTDAANVWAAWTLRNGLRIGAAYDFGLQKLRNYHSGSFEVMLGYNAFVKKDKIVHPRYYL